MVWNKYKGGTHLIALYIFLMTMKTFGSKFRSDYRICNGNKGEGIFSMEFNFNLKIAKKRKNNSLFSC